MHNWVVLDLYEKMIYKYEGMLGEKSKFGVTITERFLDTMRNRLQELKGWSWDTSSVESLKI